MLKQTFFLLILGLVFENFLMVPLFAQSLPQNYRQEFYKNFGVWQEVFSFEELAKLPRKKLANRSSQYFRWRETSKSSRDNEIILSKGAGAEQSKVFLTVLYKQKDFLPFYLDFQKPFVSSHYLESLSIWVFATNSGGTLYVQLRDNEKEVSTFLLGRLNFRGWKKLSIQIPLSFIQKDCFAAQQRTFQIESLFYIPLQDSRSTKFLEHPILFYLDEMKVQIRPKFIWNIE